MATPSAQQQTPASSSSARSSTIGMAMPEMVIDTTVTVNWEGSKIRFDLQSAVSQLSHCCLKLAAKWACEQLIGLHCDEETPSATIAPTQHVIPEMTSMELYAKSLMELGEYSHASAILSQPNPDVTIIAAPLQDLTNYGIFIRAYAMYLAGEQNKTQLDLELKEPLEHKQSTNLFLPQLRKELAQYYNTNSLDAFGLYVYGLVLKESLPTKGQHSPHQVLLDSIRRFPLNWSAWLDYAALPTNPDYDQVLHQEFASHYMYHFYTAHYLLHNQQSHHAAMQVYEKLLHPDLPLFSGSPYIACKIAVAHYHLRSFSLAQHLFLQIHQGDPYRLEDLDCYSNILYVQNQAPLLSKLAHTAMRVNKYRPETCCIVGNYYSLKNLRTKAILYFSRALKLDPNYTGAWTLMGHEYVELKNTPAAMESYRKAADISPQDYRAWYGLGQAYEILGMPLYALYYYRKAVSIRSYDARMWSAVAGCFLALDKTEEAILAFEKALTDDVEGIATTQLALLYKKDGKDDKAAQCYGKHLELRYLATTQHPESTPDLRQVYQHVAVHATEATALLFLAHYYITRGELETASICASRLLEYPGPEKEEGKAVLRELASRRAASNLALRSHKLSPGN